MTAATVRVWSWLSLAEQPDAVVAAEQEHEAAEVDHATAALVVGKLCSSKRQQNALSAAIKEYGALRRTIHAAQFLSDEDRGTRS